MTDDPRDTGDNEGIPRNLKEVAQNIAGLVVLACTSIPVLWLAFWITAPDVPTFGSELPFPEAIAEQFPPGTPLAQFGQALEREGFSGVQVSRDGRLGQASMVRSLLLCQDTYVVFWEASADGTLVRAQGEMQLGCSRDG
ncbi:MAG: hypothetical protein AAFQ36_05210 [Pseudomonadota bacterium]